MAGTDNAATIQDELVAGKLAGGAEPLLRKGELRSAQSIEKQRRAPQSRPDPDEEGDDALLNAILGMHSDRLCNDVAGATVLSAVIAAQALYAGRGATSGYGLEHILSRD